MINSKQRSPCELVGHHIKEEEKEMFKKLHESGADLKELARKAVARKEELKGKPTPEMEATLSIGGADKQKPIKATRTVRRSKPTGQRKSA